MGSEFLEFVQIKTESQPLLLVLLLINFSKFILDGLQKINPNFSASSRFFSSISITITFKLLAFNILDAILPIRPKP